MAQPRSQGRQARLLEARETTRRAILDAALDLFITHGYGEVSIRNIAARVEYSPGAIYGYFSSKDDIFYALAEEGLRDLGARELADAPSADPIDDVRAAAWRLYEDPNALAMAARSAGSSGVTSLGKKATTFPCLSTTYLLKFHAGSFPVAPRKA